MISHFKNCSVHSFLRFTNVWIFFLFLIKWEKYTMFKSACPLLPMGFAKWKNPLSDIRESVRLEDKGRNPLAHRVYTSPFGLTEQSPGLLAGWESFPVTFRIFGCKTENFFFHRAWHSFWIWCVTMWNRKYIWCQRYYATEKKLDPLFTGCQSVCILRSEAAKAAAKCVAAVIQNWGVTQH